MFFNSQINLCIILTKNNFHNSDIFFLPNSKQCTIDLELRNVKEKIC